MTTEKLVEIPARRGKAAFLPAGGTIAIINTFGEQVVDTWAFSCDDIAEFMSMEHTRAALCRLVPRVGDTLVTNRRRPILTIIEDSSPGVHDTLMAACDTYRYQGLGCHEYHDNCTDNLRAGLAELGLEPPEIPSPFNLFMNIPWTSEGSLSFATPVGRPGDTITFRADVDCFVAFSACPQDILPINGKAGRPTAAHYRIG